MNYRETYSRDRVVKFRVILAARFAEAKFYDLVKGARESFVWKNKIWKYFEMIFVVLKLKFNELRKSTQKIQILKGIIAIFMLSGSKFLERR